MGLRALPTSLGTSFVRDAKKAHRARLVPDAFAVASPAASPDVPDIEPFDPAAVVSTSSSSSTCVVVPAVEQGPEPAPLLPPPLEHRPIEPKVETPGVFHVSLSDDASP